MVSETTTIAAEVTPCAGRERDAARSLQEQGFRVLHVGSTSISVQAPAGLWTQVFGARFDTETRNLGPESGGGQREFAVPVEESVSIPGDLTESIAAVAFARPPEFFGGRASP